MKKKKERMVSSSKIVAREGKVVEDTNAGTRG